jgi:putative hydrolase of HD superfamily
MSIKRDIELLFEIGSFRHLERGWKNLLGTDVANSSEHSFRVAWLALILSGMEKKGNHEEILKLALLHDLPEGRCGDVNYLSRQYVERDENKSVKDIFANTIYEKEILKLWRKWEGKKSIEARIVKDADNLDIDIELRELINRGEITAKVFENSRKKRQKRGEGPLLYTKSAKILLHQIRKSHSYDWHFLSPSNRFRGGDWKSKNKRDKAIF